MKRSALLFFLLLSFCISSVVAQPYYFKRYEVENGLSSNSVFCSLQDHKGFMWFGTVDGLNRFDGFTFKVFRPDRDDSRSIGNNSIISLTEDNQGTIWTGTEKGLYKFNTEHETFSKVKSTLLMGITNLNADKNGNLWFMADSKAFRYTPKTDLLMLFNFENKFDISSLCISPDGTIWTGTSTGLIRKLNIKNKSYSTYNVFLHSKPAKSVNILRVFDANAQYLLVGTSNQGVKLFNKRTKTYEDILTYNKSGSEIYVRNFVHYGGDEYWIATELGVFTYNLRTKQTVNLVKNNNNPYSISDNAVYTLSRDKEGGIWVGSFFGGLNYYPKQYNLFEKFFPANGGGSLSGNAVREICKDQYGSIWIGTEDAGLNKFDPKTGIAIPLKSTGAKTDIAYTNIHGLLAFGNQLWIGTFEHGLDIMDIRTNKVIRHFDYGTDSGSLKSNFIVNFLKTRSGKLYVGTTNGLYAYNPVKKSFRNIYFPDNYRPFIYSTLEDYKGNIWVGTIKDGAYLLNPKSGKIKQFVYDPKDIHSLNSNRVNGIFESSDRTIWLTTESGGVCKFNSFNNTFKRYTTKDGLPSNFVFKILEDSKHKLWVSSSRGLVRFDPATERMQIFTRSNGLLNDQFNYNSAFKDTLNGDMYFGSVKGMIRFNPDKFIPNTFIPPVYITRFEVYNKELVINKHYSPLKKSILFTNSITLSYDQSSFNIEFAALSYTSPEMTEYAYKLEGLDKGWTYLKSNRRAYFTELAPKKYIFYVKAANSIGFWSKKPTMLIIYIRPPFWKSPFAYFFYIIISVSLIFFLITYFDDKIKEKNRRKLEQLSYKKEKEVYQAKIDFFTNVAHEIRTPLTLIQAPLERIISKVDEVPAIKKNILVMERNTRRLLELTEQLLDFRKVETNSFSLNFVETDIVALLNDVVQRFQPAADQKNIMLQTDFPLTSFKASTDTEALNKIISNVISNAIKYCESHVIISLSDINMEANLFSIKVKSNGNLIPIDMKEKIFDTFFRIKETRSKPGTGLGLGLSRSLAELLQGSLILDVPENNMNVFSIILTIRPKQSY
ncbi:ligand-binding sensor domain-containing protein [Arcticibacter eurypsychrophilus]|uniref:ligand-binding sensor domain-containing protein n=1 Tax=Arcticibacter eurypsychrophilus TaxID=1434752 RepID=UPI00084D866B|nr:sensor histidine kinase [Arcticibacter eurypsychrophilus]